MRDRFGTRQTLWRGTNTIPAARFSPARSSQCRTLVMSPARPVQSPGRPRAGPRRGLRRSHARERQLLSHSSMAVTSFASLVASWLPPSSASAVRRGIRSRLPGSDHHAIGQRLPLPGGQWRTSLGSVRHTLGPVGLTDHQLRDLRLTGLEDRDPLHGDALRCSCRSRLVLLIRATSTSRPVPGHLGRHLVPGAVDGGLDRRRGNLEGRRHLGPVLGGSPVRGSRPVRTSGCGGWRRP
jgi:hypothetical protein